MDNKIAEFVTVARGAGSGGGQGRAIVFLAF